MISTRIVSNVSPAGEVKAVAWKQNRLRRMLMPEKTLVKIPNRSWTILTFPFNLMEDVINASAARITFKIHVPSYVEGLLERIAEKLQSICYDTNEEIYLHQKSAARSLIRMVSKKSPQLFLAGDVISISCYNEGYQRAVRFTPWSLIPAELLQVRIIWDEDTNLLNRINEVEIDLLFDQRLINGDFSLKINKQGQLNLQMNKWLYNFDIDSIRNAEIPNLDKLETPPKEHLISSDSSPEMTKPRPKKRIRLMNRFAISSDDDL